LDVTYPFSNKKEKNLVSIPRGKVKKKVYLKREQFTELYHVFINKNYPETWKKGYAEKAHYSLGLFLAQYLCNGFNLADATRLQYNLMANLLLAAGGKNGICTGGCSSNSELTNWDGTKKRNGWGVS
jgi:hypothetical protein